MSQHPEITASKSDQWKALDSTVPSAKDIDNIYAEVWNDRKNTSKASLTPIERMQYERQNSAGLPVDNQIPKMLNDDFKIYKHDQAEQGPHLIDGAAERAQHNAQRACRESGISSEPYNYRQGPNFYDRPGTHAGASFNYDSQRHERLTSGYETQLGHHRVRPLKPEVEEHLGRVRPLKPETHDRSADLTQKVSYPDGSSRVVLRNTNGEITAVVNPDGSRLERQPSVDGHAPAWKAFSHNNVEITADSFRGQVNMTEDGTFRMLKTYPVPQVYEQKPDGSYRHAYKGGAKTQWSAAQQEQTILYPTGKTRVIDYKPDAKGILRETSVSDR